MSIRKVLLFLLAGAGASACGSDDAGPGSEGPPESAVSGVGGGEVGGAGGEEVGGAGAGGASSGAGGAGGSKETGGSTNRGGSMSIGGNGGGGSPGGAGAVNVDAGSGSSGSIWYDGEPGGMPYSAGKGELSAGSTASESTDNPHAGSKSLHISLNATTSWGHIGWFPSLDRKVFDISSHTTMQYWIRTASGTATTLQMEMHGPGGGCPWINVKDYLPGGPTTTWQKVTIPLSAFKIDPKKIQVVDFWLAAGTAEFFIDDAEWN